MKKYFLNNDEEIKFGDIINATKDEGYKTTIITCIFDKDSIDFLKELGIVIEKDVENSNTNTKSSNTKENNIKYNFNNNIKNSKEKNISNKIIKKYSFIDRVLDYVANKLNGTTVDALIYLNNLEKINISAALSVYLKIISHELNKKYIKTDIIKLPEIYIISIYSGKVVAIYPKNIKDLNNFTWFRSKEDAEFARSCVINLIEKMFGKDDQSKD